MEPGELEARGAGVFVGDAQHANAWQIEKRFQEGSAALAGTQDNNVCVRIGDGHGIAFSLLNGDDIWHYLPYRVLSIIPGPIHGHKT